MNDSRLALFELLKRDPRYKLEAYIFIFEALNYAHEKTPLGKEYTKSETLPALPETTAKKIETQVCRARKRTASDWPRAMSSDS